MKLQTIEYLLRFVDGGQEHYQVAYTGSIQVDIFQQRYRGHVSHQLSIYNRAGERFEKVDVDRRMELSPLANTSAANDWRSWHDCDFGPEPYLSEDKFEELIDWLMLASAASVCADKRRLESQFQRFYKGVEAISEVD